MIITIDIGNTNITFGTFNEGSDQPVHCANIQTNKTGTTDELAIQYMNLRSLWNMDPKKSSDSVVVCSVVPQVDYEFQHMFEKYYGIQPVFVGSGDVPLTIRYDHPEEIGADRIVDAYAAVRRFPGKNLIIVDFGTATTFDVVSEGKSYEGGLIMTGILSSLRALTEKASKLPNVDLSVPSRLIGKNTADGIRSGIINGSGAMVDELVRRISAELGWQEAEVIATGGLSKLIRHSSRSIKTIDTQLTLKGLYYIWKLKNG